MCGIFGYISSIKNKIDKFKLIEATNQLKHRGPDNFDYYENVAKNYVFLGHQRLSIIDLDTAANQPMISSDNRYVLIYNGEIYNHIELRKYLVNNYNILFRTNSDTETLLNLLIYSGIEKSLQLLDGMFAFCLYDNLKNQLIISRDRVGEKPLYLYFNKNYMSFSSDLKSFKKLPDFKKKLNYDSINNYFFLNYIPSPQSIYLNTFKLPQSNYMTIDLDKFEFKSYGKFDEVINDNYIRINRYWNNYNTNESQISFSKAIDTTEKLLYQSIEEKLISDVPICAFLSGGVDSSLIASLLSKINNKIDTFTVQFNDDEYDESANASNIASALGLKNYKLNISKSEINNSISLLPEIYSEPFADSSQIPTYLISKKIKENATVALGGDGGDELFGGYNRYLYYNKYNKIINFTPTFIKNMLIRLDSSKISNFYLQKLLNLIINEETNNNNNRNKKIIDKLLMITDGKSYYESMINQNLPKNFFVDSNSFDKSKIEYNYDVNNKNFEQQMMNNDIRYYLPDDILCKVDRASMYNSLEVRSPFLSKKLIDFSQNLPLKYKIKNGTSKYILKKLLEKYIPKKLIYRPKKGFAVPIRDLLKNELKDWSSEMLSKNIINKFNILNYDKVKKVHQDHLNNKKNNEHILWSIIQLNQWLLNEGI